MSAEELVEAVWLEQDPERLCLQRGYLTQPGLHPETRGLPPAGRRARGARGGAGGSSSPDYGHLGLGVVRDVQGLQCNHIQHFNTVEHG